jgi:hypothetical protein
MTRFKASKGGKPSAFMDTFDQAKKTLAQPRW